MKMKKLLLPLVFSLVLYGTASADLLPLGTNLEDVEGQVVWNSQDSKHKNTGYYTPADTSRKAFLGVPIERIYYVFTDNKLDIIEVLYNSKAYGNAMWASLIAEYGRGFNYYILDNGANAWVFNGWEIINTVDDRDNTVGMIYIMPH